MNSILFLPLVFGASIFVSATLLFCVQPMVARMFLPLLGGTPAVWNTCVLFFQSVLLAGYAYAHWSGRILGVRRQVIVHFCLLGAVVLTLPILVPAALVLDLPSARSPILWLISALAISVGLPFFMVSTSAPLLQRWFSLTTHPQAADPYFLYAASNAGSLLALVSYPLLLEPALRLSQQTSLWSGGYVLYLGLLIGCAVLLLRHLAKPGAVANERRAERNTKPNSAVRLQWVLLAFIPSSLMLSVTTYLTTDVASVPLLWVLPLSIYLATFIIAFGNRRLIPEHWFYRSLPVGALALTYLLLSEATHPVWLLILLHLVFFFIASLSCHQRVAQGRPGPTYLTEYYLWISVGGVLGGLFNSILAPLLFSSVLEYPITIILACWLGRPNPDQKPSASQSHRDWWMPLALGGVTFAIVRLLQSSPGIPGALRLALAVGLPLVVCYFMVDRPLRFSLGLVAVMLGCSFFEGMHGRILLAERNFFGVLRVTEEPAGRFRRLVHGNTLHGKQFIDPARQLEPLSYYHRTGPVSQILRQYQSSPSSTNVAIVGLGTGSLLSYSRKSEFWSCYEINPAVIAIAENPAYFNFIRGAAGRYQMVLGDARLRLQEAPEQQFGLIVVDAFSSDSIPVHLITLEAIQLYMGKLTDHGLLAFHISNRTLDLEPVIAALAYEARLFCLSQDEVEPNKKETDDGKDQSHWVVLARQRGDLGLLLKDGRWLPIRPRRDVPVWHDDFSNILRVIRWD